MIKPQLSFIGLLLIPMYTYANCYIDIGKGDSSGSVTFQEIENGDTTSNELDKSGSTEFLSFGCSISKKISLSIEYVEFSESFNFFGSKSELESKNFGISTFINLYQSEKVKFAVGAGYGKWNTRTQIAEARWDFTSTPVTLFIEEKTRSINGYTPYSYVNLIHSFNRNLSLGFKYNYYSELGYIEPILDLDALSIGDLSGALQAGPSKNSSVEIYSLYFRWSF